MVVSPLMWVLATESGYCARVANTLNWGAISHAFSLNVVHPEPGISSFNRHWKESHALQVYSVVLGTKWVRLAVVGW